MPVSQTSTLHFDGFGDADFRKRHITQEQLARRWCLSARTLERWRWLQRGPSYLRLGGRVAYRIEDVAKFESENLKSILPGERK